MNFLAQKKIGNPKQVILRTPHYFPTPQQFNVPQQFLAHNNKNWHVTFPWKGWAPLKQKTSLVV